MRKRVAYMLLEAARLIGPEYRILVFDGWRSIRLQRQLFDERKDAIMAGHPEYSEEEAIAKTTVYVAPPSYDRTAPSPHSTGGAVDVTMCDESNQPAEMGTPFDYFGRESQTRYYEEKIGAGERLETGEQLFLENRRILYHSLTGVGFSNYCEEWWHFDYGNHFWGRIKGENSIYGAIHNSAVRRGAAL